MFFGRHCTYDKRFETEVLVRIEFYQKHLRKKCSYAYAYYNRLDVRSSHYVVKKSVVVRGDFTQVFVPFCGFGQDNSVVSHSVAIRGSNSATGVEIVKKSDFGVGFIVVRFFR